MCQFNDGSTDYAPVMIDPWGMPFVYDRNSPEGASIIESNHNPKSMDLYSYGPNSIDEDGAKDDITNR
jgi:hypothetical protein